MKTKHLVVTAILLAVFSVSASAQIGLSSLSAGGPKYPALHVHIKDSAGTTTPWTSAIIGSGDNVPFNAIVGQTAGYCYDPGTSNRWVQQFLPNPLPSGDYQWLVHIETGTTDLRSEHTFEWLRDDSGDRTWYLIGYAVDTRRRISYTTIEPGAPSYGTFTTKTSRGGYDLILASTSPVPEPGCLATLGIGLGGMTCGMLRRKR